MHKTLKLNSIFEDGKFKGKKVSDIANNKKEIFNLIKNGFSFDDEVLEIAGIKRTVRDVRTTIVIAEHEKETKTYPKETENYKQIMKHILTLDNYNVNENIVEEDNDEQNFEE